MQEGKVGWIYGQATFPSGSACGSVEREGQKWEREQREEKGGCRTVSESANTD